MFLIAQLYQMAYTDAPRWYRFAYGAAVTVLQRRSAVDDGLTNAVQLFLSILFRCLPIVAESRHAARDGQSVRCAWMRACRGAQCVGEMGGLV